MKNTSHVVQRKWFAFFLSSVLAGFVFAVVAKVMTVGSNAPIIREVDSVLPIPKVYMFLVAIVFETMVVTFLLVAKRDENRIQVIAFATLVLLGYRFLSVLIDPTVHCACLGSMGSWIGLSPGRAEMATLIFLCYCLAGVVLYVFLRGKNMREPLAEASPAT